MKNLETIKYENASPEVKKQFDAIKAKVGKVPNIYATMANSPVALQAFLDFGAALRKGELKAKEIEAIALSVAQQNKCHYCLAAHTAISKGAGLSEKDIIDLRLAKNADPKLAAIALLAKEIVATNGYPQQKLVDAFFAAGYSKAALVELVNFVALNVLTNFFNHVADTELDFPEAAEIAGRN
jgi:uncharacterized peroxidase-related enzyme